MNHRGTFHHQHNPTTIKSHSEYNLFTEKPFNSIIGLNHINFKSNIIDIPLSLPIHVVKHLIGKEDINY